MSRGKKGLLKKSKKKCEKFSLLSKNLHHKLILGNITKMFFLIAALGMVKGKKEKIASKNGVNCHNNYY